MAYLALQATMYSPTSGPLLKVVLKRQIKCSIVITIILRTCALNYRLALNEKWSNSAKKEKRKEKKKEKWSIPPSWNSQNPHGHTSQSG